jgi:hypothetical protein
MMRTKQALSLVLAASLGMVVSSHSAFAQSVTVETRSAAESQTNVRVQGGQGVEVDTKTKAQSGTKTQVQGGAAGVSVESGAAAASQTRVRTGEPPAPQPMPSQAMPSQAMPSQAMPSQAMPPQAMPPQAVSPQVMPSSGYPASQPEQPIAIPAAPPVAVPSEAPAANASVTVGTTVPGNGRPASCEKIEEISIDDMNIKIVNKSCRGKITSLQAWRENGKTKVQFFFDNKGFSNTTIKMSETWFDRRGRAINESIDEQKFAIEAGHNKAVVLTGPIPQAMTAVINFYR